MTKDELQSLLEEAQEANKVADYKKAKKLAGQIIEAPDIESLPEIEIPTFLSLSEALIGLHESNEALKYVLLTVKKAESTQLQESKSWIAKGYNFAGLVNSNMSEYPKALQFYQKALETYEQLGDKSGIAINTGNIGDIYNRLSDYPKALEFFQKALEISEQIGDKNGIASITGNIGVVYGSLSDFKKALASYQKALEIFEQIGNLKGIANNTSNIGNVYLHLSDFQNALTFYQRALEINKQIGNLRGVASSTGNMGSVYYFLSDYQKALDSYQSALEIHEQIGNKRGVASFTGNIGSVYANRNYEGYNADKGEEYLQKAIVISEELGTEEIKKDCHKELSDLYRQTGRLEEAIQQLELYYQIKETIHSKEVKRQAARFTAEREILEKDKEIAVQQAATEAKFQATTDLLHKVLPDVIANRILEGETEIADYFPVSTILFADVVGFTPMTTDIPAYMLVRLLNGLFGRFDAIIRKHGCTKIKTIGDGYMAVAGAPEPKEDHAERMVQAALEMLEPIEIPAEIEAFMPENTELKVRIGIHTGPIVAGVVGDERFMYDIYSEAVNIASRMETHGDVGRIHVSGSFMRHLMDRFAMTKNTDHGISFEKRGEIEVKGKGKMKTFFLSKVE